MVVLKGKPNRSGNPERAKRQTNHATNRSATLCVKRRNNKRIPVKAGGSARVSAGTPEAGRKGGSERWRRGREKSFNARGVFYGTLNRVRQRNAVPHVQR